MIFQYLVAAPWWVVQIHYPLFVFKQIIDARGLLEFRRIGAFFRQCGEMRLARIRFLKQLQHFKVVAHARAVVELLQAEHLSAFTLADLAAKRPDWTRHTLRTALDELLALEVLTSPQRGRPRCYELVPNALDTFSAPAVRLLPVQGENRLATRAIG